MLHMELEVVYHYIEAIAASLIQREIKAKKVS